MNRSAPKGGQVSVFGEVNPQHQGQRQSHEGPGDAAGAGGQGAAFRGGSGQVFTQLQVVPGQELEQLVQKDHGHGDL